MPNNIFVVYCITHHHHLSLPSSLPPPLSPSCLQGIHLTTAELVSLAGDSDRLHVKQLDRDILELKDKVRE